MPGTYLNHYPDHLQRIAEYDDLVVRIQTVDATLAQIEVDIGNVGSADSVISLNASELISPLIVNIPGLDLGYLLGSSETGYSNPGGAIVNVTANSTEGGIPNDVLSKNSASPWYSTNASSRTLTIDFGFNKSTRKIKLNSLGFKSYFGNGLFYPLTLIIAGSDNNSTYTTLTTWTGINFNADSQWKYITFVNNNNYRYIRITQSGLNSGGNNYFSCRDLRFYGSIQNP